MYAAYDIQEMAYQVIDIIEQCRSQIIREPFTLKQ